MSTALATKPKTPDLLSVINSEHTRDQIAKAIPKHMTADRMARVACTTLRKSPKLMKCTVDSVLSCLITCSQYGLEPDGRRAHLIPFDDKKNGVTICTLILDYKGLVELALRSGLVSTLHADIVQEGDIFEYSLGKITKHTPWFLRRDPGKPANAGEVYAVYALCENRDGTSKCEVLSMSEIDGIRARSKSGDSGPWVTDWSEMAKKTAFKRLSKWLVLSPEFRDATNNEDDDTNIIETTAVHVQPSTKLTDLITTQKHLSDCVPDNEPYPGDDEDTSDAEVITPKGGGSGMPKCVEFFLAQPDCKKKSSDPETGRIEFSLPNGKVILLSETPVKPLPDDKSVVEVMDSDAFTQCKNIYVANSKKG